MSGSVDRVLNELEAQHNEQAAAILPARVSNRATVPPSAWTVAERGSRMDMG